MAITIPEFIHQQGNRPIRHRSRSINVDGNLFQVREQLCKTLRHIMDTKSEQAAILSLMKGN